ncbi:hypothetical protein [Corynebacterium auriscanis]|uniref:hypothetical protein n=1 Tax=Corynebacterium auriscanis TaxID=99807 RepID=UPI003CEFBBC8
MEVDFVVSGNVGVSDEDVPGLVGVFQGRLCCQVVAYLDRLCSTATVINLVADVLMLGLESAVSVFEFLG